MVFQSRASDFARARSATIAGPNQLIGRIALFGAGAILAASAVPASAEDIVYKYDARGRLVQVAKTGGPANVRSTYCYDKADNRRVVNVAFTSDTSASLDAICNTASDGNDANGDDRDDIFWRSDTGTFTNWLAQPNGGFVANTANVWSEVPLAWQVAGTGDFNGDGRDDVLWRKNDGWLADWLGTLPGGYQVNDSNFLVQVSTAWHVVGTGDFNGDQRTDILWRHDNGDLSNWLGGPSGAFTDNYSNSSGVVATSWKVAGTGDFNGDGRSDILWRNDNGDLSDWLGQPNGGFVNNGANAGANVSVSWKVTGTGDFNGDGRDDILWRNDDGSLTNWLGTSNGGFVSNGTASSYVVSTQWKVVDVGDYNGDGRDDILWRGPTGAVSNWLATPTGAFTINDANAYSEVSTSWQVVGGTGQ